MSALKSFPIKTSCQERPFFPGSFNSKHRSESLAYSMHALNRQQQLCQASAVRWSFLATYSDSLWQQRWQELLQWAMMRRLVPAPLAYSGTISNNHTHASGTVTECSQLISLICKHTTTYPYACPSTWGACGRARMLDISTFISLSVSLSLVLFLSHSLTLFLPNHIPLFPHHRGRVKKSRQKQRHIRVTVLTCTDSLCIMMNYSPLEKAQRGRREVGRNKEATRDINQPWGGGVSGIIAELSEILQWMACFYLLFF